MIDIVLWKKLTSTYKLYVYKLLYREFNQGKWGQNSQHERIL